MKKISFIAFAVWGFIGACTTKSDVPKVKKLDTGGIEAVAPYLTHDNKGNAVLCWTEKDGKDSLYRLKYALYNTETDRFDPAVTVPASAGCSNSAESMGKVAFKADGSVFAIFARRFPAERNPYAGAVYYSFSKDDGQHWSDAQFLHSDTAHTYGRSFFDIITLKDGEIAAIWLDGRYGKSIKGSALFFARTEKGKSFTADTCLDKGTCECCRTDIFSDGAGNIHLAYRNITFPSALSEKQVRDMAYKVSSDNGKTFSEAKTISEDNWQIEGCPHSGPSMTSTKSGTQVVWFTAGGGAGLYYASAAGTAGDFRKRHLITASGRHPQLVAMPGGEKLAMVCEEPLAAEHANEMNHSHGKMKMGHMPAGSAKITLNVLKDGNTEKSISLTDGKAADNHAVLIPLKDKLLVAWVREEKSGSKLYYSRLNINE